MLYKGHSWGKDLPSDSEIIAIIFARLLDDGYFSNKEKAKVGIPHYLDAAKINFKMADD